MDLWDLTRLLLRRWYFAAPMLVASVALVIFAAETVSPDYKATGYMQLIPAPSTGKTPDPKAKPRPANPWLDLGYAALGNASAITVSDTTSLERLVKEGYSDSVTVVMNQQTPLFEIEAVGNSKEQATGTVRQVIKLLQADIASKQKQYGALPEDTISTLVINDGSAPQLETGKKKRVIIVAAGVGLLMTTASTIALDYWLRRRSRRRNEEAEGTDGSGPPIGSMGTHTSTGTAVPQQWQNGLLDGGEKTRVLRPQPAPTNGNGNVYPGDRRKAELGTPARATTGGPNGSAPVTSPANGRDGLGPADLDAPPDATVVLPSSYPRRRRPDRQDQQDKSR